MHCPVGAAEPGEMSPQTPSVPPVNAWVHALHVPVQAALQQTLFAQKPLAHVVPLLHVAPLAPPSAAASVATSPALSAAPSWASGAVLSTVESPMLLSAAPSEPVSIGVELSFASGSGEVSPCGPSPVVLSTVASSAPASPCGMRLRSKLTSSSQPDMVTRAVPAAIAAASRPHLIVRWVFIALSLIP